MNCQQVREFIDQRVHDPTSDGSSDRGRGGSPNQQDAERSEVDAHLSACPRCRAEFAELRRVRGLLATAANDRPSDTEISNMWTAIQAGIATGGSTVNLPTARKRNNFRSLVAPIVGVAAVLTLGFLLGEMRFGRSRVLEYFAPNEGFSTVNSTLRAPGDDHLDAETRRAMMSLGYVGGAPPPKSMDERNAARGLETGRYAGGFADAGGTPSKPSAPAPASPPMIEQERHSDARAVARKAKNAAPTGGQTIWFEDSPGKPSLAAKTASNEDVEADEGSASLLLPHTFSQDNALMRTSRTAATTSRTGDQEKSSTEESVGAAPRGSAPTPQTIRIIKTGDLVLEVPACADVAEDVERLVREMGGFVADGSTQTGAGGAAACRIIARVPPERFEEAFTSLKALGRVESENVKAADVTADYVDLEARIHSLQITEERLRELIANKSFVDKISALLEVEKELNRVRTEIEQAQGQLRVMADRVGLSTIVVTLREPGRMVPSASLSVEVATLDDSAKALGDLLGRTGGRLVSGKTSKRADGTLMGMYQLETNLARFAEVVSGVESLGRVEERQVRDQQFGSANSTGAEQVKCTISLVLFERSTQLPAGSMRIEVESLETGLARLAEILPLYGSTMSSNQSARTPDGGNAAEIRVRVPAGRFAEFLEAAATIGRLVAKNTSGDTGRIVGGAAIVPCEVGLTLAERRREIPSGTMNIEVEKFDIARQALSKAIADRGVQVLSSSSHQRSDGTWQGAFRLGVPAKNMEAFVTTLEGFGRVAARDIRGLGLGDLASVDPDSIGTIELALGEKSTITPAANEREASIRGRVRAGLGGLYESIGLIAYGLVVLLPWLLLAVVLGLLVSRIRARMRKNAASQQHTG